MKIDIPEFNFSIDTSVGNLSFNHKNIHPQPFIYEDSFGNMLIILGRPHIKGKSLKEEIKEILMPKLLLYIMILIEMQGLHFYFMKMEKKGILSPLRE